MDFRVGGRERVKGGFDGGVTTTFDAIYHDIVPRERIVYTYEMHLDERKISVSLATLEIEPAGAGRTKLKVCEQGAFLDGYDDAGKREHGTGDLLDKLGASLSMPDPWSRNVSKNRAALAASLGAAVARELLFEGRRSPRKNDKFSPRPTSGVVLCFRKSVDRAAGASGGATTGPRLGFREATRKSRLKPLKSRYGLISAGLRIRGADEPISETPLSLVVRRVEVVPADVFALVGLVQASPMPPPPPPLGGRRRRRPRAPRASLSTASSAARSGAAGLEPLIDRHWARRPPRPASPATSQ